MTVLTLLFCFSFIGPKKQIKITPRELKGEITVEGNIITFRSFLPITNHLSGCSSGQAIDKQEF